MDDTSNGYTVTHPMFRSFQTTLVLLEFLGGRMAVVRAFLRSFERCRGCRGRCELYLK